MSFRTPFHDLLSPQGALRQAYYGSEPLILRQAASVEGLPTSAEIDRLIDASLLRWPYFTVFQDGVRPEQAEVTTSRSLLGHEVDGFVRPEGVRRQLAAGATCKLSQIEDWHRFTRDQIDELHELFPAEVTAFLFLTPEGKRGMLPHRDASRVMVIQLEGAKEWHLFHDPAHENPDAGLDVDPATEVGSFVLEPGDVLYLPHAYGHAASAVGQTSLHVTFTLSEPTPDALVDALVAEWIDAGRLAALNEDAPLGATAKLHAVADDLARFAVDTGSLVTRALADGRARDLS
ncbi:JmjC domain-containing protein [Amycolatopsis sp. H20-H5]|uniref:JmjC domain-containing protein n=1 Tax=Amycolatopsis sp. H20-H5 TaxID=3046309 RepID=UPI002DBD7813|nr:cupin domain-containing protein [Amycolatopsis sp. H20-H5]MEC3976879.1 cupin domain-containing protein [Amycolatopsis sp. H20-H5]